jgi:hypothetical protein
MIPPRYLDAAFWSGQLCRIESQFFAGVAHQARVKDLAGMAERNLRLSAFSMHRHHDRTLMPPIMLAMIDAAASLNEPLSKCIAFHTFAPAILIAGFSFHRGSPIDHQFSTDAWHRGAALVSTR